MIARKFLDEELGSETHGTSQRVTVSIVQQYPFCKSQGDWLLYTSHHIFFHTESYQHVTTTIEDSPPIAAQSGDE